MSEEIIEVHPSFVYLQELEQRVRDTLLENAKLHHELASLREWQNWPPEEEGIYYVEYEWENTCSGEEGVTVALCGIAREDGDWDVEDLTYEREYSSADKVTYLRYSGPFKPPGEVKG